MSALQFLMRSLMGFGLVLLLVGVSGISSSPTHAQTSGADKPVHGSTPGGVNDGSASDSELWRKIRRGDPGMVVGGDKSSGMMIQSGGQDWRLMRNGPLPRYTAWAILGTLLFLSLFFALRGRIKIDHGPSGRMMKRFSVIERIGHWLLASSFIILALTGLNLIFGKTLLIPIFGKDIFASITIFGKYIHNYVGFAFMLGLLMIAVMWVVHNIPTLVDLKWIARGGGIIGGGHPHARKFNAGQKIIFWVVILCGISISLSGWALMNPFSTQMFSSTFSLSNSLFGTAYATDLAPIQEQQYQSLWHAIMAVFMIVVVLAHIYIGTIGMQGALSAMTTGEVDTNWAREHHSLWVAEEEAKSGMQLSGAPLSGRSVSAEQNTGDASSSRHKLDSTMAKSQSGTAIDSHPGAPASVTGTTSHVSGTEQQRKAGTTGSRSATAAGAKAETSKSTTNLATEPTTVPPATAQPKRQTPQPVSLKSTRAAPASKASATKPPSAPTASAKKPAAVRKTAPKRSSGDKDDLKLIKGIGPQNEQRLNAIGVTLFEHIAKWSAQEQADIGRRLAFPGRIEREEWVKQAKILTQNSTGGQ